MAGADRLRVPEQESAEWGRGPGVAPCPGEGISVGSSHACQSAQ